MPLETPSINDIVLIGPMCAGKSTVGKLLAEALGVPQVSLDALCFEYYYEVGTDSDIRNAPDGMMTWQCNVHAVERVLSSHAGCVIDFGAGHSVYREEIALARVQAALSPYPNVVLILPSPDIEESLRVLQERAAHIQWLEDFRRERGYDPNEHFLRHPSNLLLAKYVVYTLGKTPEETRDEIIGMLGIRADGSP